MPKVKPIDRGLSRRALKWMTGAIVLAVLACGKIYEEAEPPPNAFELAEGTRIAVLVKPADPVETLEPGDSFAGVLAEALHYKWEAVDPEGRTYERQEIVAPRGAPALGEVTEERDSTTGQARTALRLTSVTFHGGKSFPVVTAPILVREEDKAAGEPLAFELTEPAQGALIVE